MEPKKEQDEMRMKRDNVSGQCTFLLFYVKYSTVSCVDVPLLRGVIGSVELNGLNRH